MRFFYLDPGLIDDIGHHANYCRYIVGELRARGIETFVFGHDQVIGKLSSELGVSPLFRIHTYRKLIWLSDFELFARCTFEELERLPGIQASDVVYMVSTTPVQLMAVTQWLQHLAADRRPTVVVEIGDTGLVASNGQAGLTFAMPDARNNPRPTLFRHAADRLPAIARLHFITFDRTLSEAVNFLLARPVRTLPLPYRAVTALRNRAGAKPIVVAILGHQRGEKGLLHLPEIAATLLRARPDVRLQIQNVAPEGAPKAQQELRKLAANSDRLILYQQPAGRTLWPQLLEQSDLILCPYYPNRYIASFSAVASEALANGIPVVVPAATTLEKLLEECGRPGVAFDNFEPKLIVDATVHALNQFDRYATLAYNAAMKWPDQRGPTRLVDGLLTLVSPAG
jgi:glycosyltransferase involved in cell wall biosynthesis